MLAHGVTVLLFQGKFSFFQLTHVALEADFDLDVQVTLVAGVGLHGEVAVDTVALFGRDAVLQIEDCLFPVRVLVCGSSAKEHSLVALGEVHAEEAYQAVHEVVPIHGEFKRRAEVHVFHFHRVQVHFLDAGRSGAHLGLIRFV